MNGACERKMNLPFGPQTAESSDLEWRNLGFW